MDQSPLELIRIHGGVPQHIAVIMDGNGRWAVERHLPRPLGHHAGMQAVREVVAGCLDAGVGYLSLFAFSTENWQRPPSEVTALMGLLEEYVAKETDELAEKGVRVVAMGELQRLEEPSLAALQRVTERTAGGDRLVLNLCISYSSRAEITRAARRLAADVVAGRRQVEQIDEEAVASQLYTNELPEPDLLIRTSGELRLSNFLLWQLAYAELYVTPVLWPDFRRAHLFEAILDFQRRDRRFGRVPV